MSYERLGFAQCPLCGIVGVGGESPFICRLCVAVRESAERWSKHARSCRSYERYLREPYDDSWEGMGGGPEYVPGEPWGKVKFDKRTATLVSMESTRGVRFLDAEYVEGEVLVAVAFDLPHWPAHEALSQNTVCGGSRPTRVLPAYKTKIVEHHAGCGRASCLLWAARRGQVHPPWMIHDLYCWND